MLREQGLTSEMDRIRLYAMDDIFGLLKKGASAIWDQRHALFPTIAPMIDKAVTMGKSAVAALSGAKGLSKEIVSAVTSDHS